MASIQREIEINAPAAKAWDALRDVGALHTRLAPGFVTDTRLEPGARVVTFGNGMVVRELIIDVSEERRRVAWSTQTAQLTHYSASAQVFEAGDGKTRFVWIADLLPHEAAPMVTGMIEQGLATIKRTLEASAGTSKPQADR
jgi:carbon monoxide dehydrogenase subunit G